MEAIRKTILNMVKLSYLPPHNPVPNPTTFHSMFAPVPQQDSFPGSPTQQMAAHERQVLVGLLEDNFDQSNMAPTEEQRLAIFQEQNFRRQGFSAFSFLSDRPYLQAHSLEMHFFIARSGKLHEN